VIETLTVRIGRSAIFSSLLVFLTPTTIPVRGTISVHAVLNALKMAVGLPEPESAPKFDPASPVRFVMR
tara:strand:+ start:249 stop:455 length:207 start_codon:yes stop_codon:yes gene_type:complete